MFWYEHALRIQWRSYSGWSVNILNLCLPYKITRKCYLASLTSTRFLKLCKTYPEICLLEKNIWFPVFLFFFFSSLLLARHCLLARYILVYMEGVTWDPCESSPWLSFCFQTHRGIRSPRAGLLCALPSCSPRLPPASRSTSVALRGRFLSLCLFSDLASKPPWVHEQNSEEDGIDEKTLENISQLPRGERIIWLQEKWIHFRVNVQMSEIEVLPAFHY